MTADRRVLWVDAFTDRPMGGNPCPVVFDAAALTVEQRIAFTRESGQVECAFLVGSDEADFGARYYTAAGEIRMAGAPTIAVAAALDAAQMLGGRARFTIEVGAGVLPVEVERSNRLPVFTMTQFAPSFGRTYTKKAIAALVGLGPRDIADPPRTVSTGTAFLITRLRSAEALANAKLDVDALEAFRQDADFFEPFLCVTQGFTEAGDTSARLLLPPPMPPEDPFTGSATGCMAAWLWHNGLIDSPRFTAEQGHLMGRPGRASVEVLGPAGAIEGVRVGGTGVVLMQGTVRL